MAALLPPGYDMLEPFVAQWAKDTAAGRAQARSDSTEAERHAFYEAVKPQIVRALDELDQKPVTELDDAEKRLMQLMLAFPHVMMAVEVHGADEPRHAQYRSYMKITRAPADALA